MLGFKRKQSLHEEPKLPFSFNLLHLTEQKSIVDFLL